MILCRYPFTALLLDIKLSYHVIEAYEKPFKGSKAPIVDMGTYEFKGLNSGKITSEEMFMDAYQEEIHELYQFRNSTKRLGVILDAKYEKTDLNKVIEN